MILEFKVANYLSIKEEQVLSFEATSDSTLDDIYIVKKGKYRVLKSAMIYGANASGKTNVLGALNLVGRLLSYPPTQKDEQTEHMPFMLDEMTRLQDGWFELSFFAGEILYIYSLEINRNWISREKLMYYPGVKPAIVFQRHYDKKKDLSHVDMGSTLKLKSTDKELLQSTTLRNISVLAAYGKLNMDIPEMERAYRFMKSKLLPVIVPEGNMRRWANSLVDKTAEAKLFVLKMLSKADFNIDEIALKTIKEGSEINIHEQMELEKFPQHLRTQLEAIKGYESKSLSFLRKVPGSVPVSFPAELESAGTNRYYDLSGILYDVINKSQCMLIDELENSLHPDLVNHFIKTFLVNAGEAQLIFTTHNINILSEQDNLRKDVIWFTQKSKDGATELYSMADFNHRKELSFINAYKAGKFGAKPKLGSIYMEE
jgi:AAA15 family ATPase/GTPase